MNRSLLFWLLAALLWSVLLLGTTHVQAADSMTTAYVGSTCTLISSSSVPAQRSRTVTVACQTPTTVHVGVCDRGHRDLDDFFTVTYNGRTLASNHASGWREQVDIRSVFLPAGRHTFSVNSVSNSGYAPYALVVSPNLADVGYHLLSRCGWDYAGVAADMMDDDICYKDIDLHTEDVAPANGRLVANIQFGQTNRPEGITLASLTVSKGQQINETITVPTPQWVRVWWQPAGGTGWTLLPSQYWEANGRANSEYGVACTDDIPVLSHKFATAIPAADVPLFQP